MENPKIQEAIDAIKAQFEKRIEEIQKRGSDRINEITDDSPDPNNLEATLNVTFDVKWRTTSIKFDIPKFSSERQNISFDVPTVKMITKTFAWDEPATRMETRCIAKKPEVTCKGFPPRCTVKMTCIYADVPVGYMKRREIKTDIPEFSMKRQDISFNKPTVRFETVEIKMDLPQFYLRSLSGELRNQQNEFENVSNEMTSEIAKAQNQMDIELLSNVSEQISELYGNIRKQLLDERNNVSSHYNDAIIKMKSTIKGLKENNAFEEVVKLEPQLAKLVSDYNQILSDIDKGIEDLIVQETEALKNLKLH
jgi:hypothetical protein